MHELAICQALLGQVADLARRHAASHVARIVVRAGPLSGVEPALLSEAFTLARAGTPAAEATLEIEAGRVRVHCPACGTDADVPPNRLTCPACANWRTQLVSGDELLLERVEFAAAAVH